jgi:uncharacterized membrane protein YcaP (DUF421 family)
MIKSVVAIAALFLLARILGKKQISQLTFFDYVVGISIGSVAASFASDPAIGYVHGLTSMAIFALFPLLLTAISLKSYPARKLLEGKPTILIQNGEIIVDNLRKVNLSVNDLLEECRLKNAFQVQEIEYAIFETSGKLSVLMKPAMQPLTPQDMNLPGAAKGICTNVIVDGTILDDNLSALGMDRVWLAAELSRLNVAGPEGVILCYADASRGIHVFKRDAGVKITPIM